MSMSTTTAIVFGSPEARAIQTRDAQLREEERAIQDKLAGIEGNTYAEKLKGIEKMLGIIAADITDAEDQIADAEIRLDSYRAEERRLHELSNLLKVNRPEIEP